MGNLANSEAEVVRIAGLLRGTESAAQAVSVCIVFLPDLTRLTDRSFVVWPE